MRSLSTLLTRIKYLTLLLLVALMPLLMGVLPARTLNAADNLNVSFFCPDVNAGTNEYFVAVWLTDGATFVGSLGHYSNLSRYQDQWTYDGVTGTRPIRKPNGTTDAKLGSTQSFSSAEKTARGRTFNFTAADVSSLPNKTYTIHFETVRHNNNYAKSTGSWVKNGTPLTNSPLTVTRTGGSTTDIFKNVTLTYTTGGASAPAFTTQPNNLTVTAPASATFTIVATGATSYQWQRGTTNISGANSASYTLSPTTTADSGSNFRCIATNATGSTPSNAATLTVNNAAAPSVTGPTAQSVLSGSTATFSVTATSAVSMTYQWKVSTTGVGGAYNNVTGGSGATTASYTTAATITADNGRYYRCVVTNSSNGNLATTSTSALLTVSATVVAPIITAPPTSITRIEGQTATFSVTATGAPLNYQWKRGTTNVGTNSSTYSFTCTLANNGNSFTCVVTNAGGANPVTSTPAAILTVNAAPPIPVITGAATASVYENNAFNYAFTLSGSPTSCTASGLPAGLSLTSNATSGTITGTPTESGVFSVVLTASNGTGDGTKDLELTVIGVPVITSDASVSVLVNTPFSYTITADNTPTSFSATGLPATLTLNTTSGVITGTPTSLTTHSVTITATNAAGASTAEPLSIIVNDGSSTPSAAPVEPKKCGYGSGFSTFLLLMMACLSLMIRNRRVTRTDKDN